MKTINAIILLFSLAYFPIKSYSHDWIKDTCEIKGPVKSLDYHSKNYVYPGKVEWEKNHYEYNEQRFMVKLDRSSSWSGENFNAYFRVFDNSGILCLIAYNLADGDTTSRTEFTYNTEGNAIESNYYTGGKYWNTTTYTHNDHGLLTHQSCKLANGNIFEESFQYDDNDKKVYHEDVSTNVTQLKYWIYNDLGYLMEEKNLDSNRAPRTTYYMSNEGDVDSTVKADNSKNVYTKDSYILRFTYNKAGREIENIKTDADENLVSKSTFTYNKMGYKKTQVYFNAKNDQTYNYTYQYQYDNYGNWTSKITKFDGKLFREETQIIKYY
jgi:hypothetical protein